MLLREHKKALTLSSLGGLLEFYDFIIYALLAGYLSQLFFPETSSINGLLAVFSAYAVGYFARPFGGLIFGHFGDKYGRKKTFTISILMMALSTLLIGLLPTYETIGALAPVFLVVFRIFQGISVGGEIPGAITYISEIAPEKKGFMTGTIFCFLTAGVAVGFIVEAVLLTIYTHQVMLDWAWRIPFILGGVFGLIAYYLRRQLMDIKSFRPFIEKEFALPVTKLLKTQLWNFIYGTVLVSFGALAFVTLFIFLPSYISKVLSLKLTNFIWMNSLGVIILSILCIAIGFCADKMSKTVLLVISCVLLLFLPTVIYGIYISQASYYFYAILLSAIVCAFCWGNIPAILVELYQQDVRYTGIGFAYNLGFAVFGGLTPLIVLSVIKVTHDVSAPSYVLAVGSIITLIFIVLNSIIKRVK